VAGLAVDASFADGFSSSWILLLTLSNYLCWIDDLGASQYYLRRMWAGCAFSLWGCGIIKKNNGTALTCGYCVCTSRVVLFLPYNHNPFFFVSAWLWKGGDDALSRRMTLKPSVRSRRTTWPLCYSVLTLLSFYRQIWKPVRFLDSFLADTALNISWRAVRRLKKKNVEKKNAYGSAQYLFLLVYHLPLSL
jgi:hypothetical protein